MSSAGQEANEQDSASQRKTRAPYIQRACIECKRRKQRCSGHDPCKNCESRSVRCKYSNNDSPPILNEPATDYLTAVTSQVKALNSQVESMQAEIRSLKQVTGIEELEETSGSDSLRDKRELFEQRQSKKRKLPPPATIAVSPPPIQGPRYQGLTSADYSLKLTSLNLAQMQNPTGAKPSDLDACYDRGEGKEKSPSETKVSEMGSQSSSDQVSVQVFTEISHSKARELVILYSEVVGSLHPIVDISIVLECVDGLYARLEATKDNPERQTGRYDVIVVRLILAIALLSEQKHNSALIESCYEGVEQELKSILCSETVSLRGVTLVLLWAIYHLYSNRVRMAWRLCGTSASLAMELGLHRPETLQKAFPNDSERFKAVRVMWSIFILDHGWSAALGLPRNFDDAALDSTQLVPSDSVYLRSMASYCVISTKIVNATSKVPVDAQVYEDEQFQFLNYQIDRWQLTVLDGFITNPAAGHNMTSDPFDSVSTLLYLRANQLRILLLRPLFFAESPVKPDRTKISASLQLAIRTISVIYHLNSTTDIYRKQHPFFSHFLISATSLILLIITYRGGPDLSTIEPSVFNPQDICKSLQRAIELITEYSGISNYSQQLHRRLLSIVGLLARLDILSLDVDSGNPREQHIAHAQKPAHSPMAVYMPESADLGSSFYTSPPLTSAGTGQSQHQESISDTIPFYQDDHPQMDTFLNGTIWNELDKLLVSRLHSAESPMDLGDSRPEYGTMYDHSQ
ncbi:hypothetical protein N7532_006524 [Penicillium argentinense]|uniref:Zn(2)-C6 fungal-type domain-containing protein n=1 Tax=Penicillium argentinense TaxID=1131581 RepID=A0A9W9KB01_9EURO|nr:uncharacterized protein N7532_006524 [Penicillium argentinense]KAJ5099523.1 hypothetical protein N7532_006524 [Penicillium argentinense]